jgi:RND family efflux transporter MFP subunit
MRLKHKIWLGLACVTLIAAGISFVRVPKIETVRMEKGLAVTAVYASGNVEPTVEQRIAPKVTGRLRELLADERDTVKAEQILARLDDQELAANLAQIEARLALAQQEYDRAQALLRRGSGTIQQRDKTASTLRETQAALALAQKQRNELVLTAPADGTIIRRDGEVGEIIPANQTLFTMACCAPLRVTALVDEEDIALVKAGQKVLIRADAFPEQSITGTVTAITPKGDPTARNFRVRIALPETVPLLIGMTVETNIIVAEEQDAMLLPTTAVVDNKVWVIREDRLRQVTVTTRPSSSGRVAILSVLKPDDQIVSKPNARFRDGQKAKAVTKALSPAQP